MREMVGGARIFRKTSLDQLYHKWLHVVPVSSKVRQNCYVGTEHVSSLDETGRRCLGGLLEPFAQWT